MTLEDEIKAICQEWSDETCILLKESLEKALSDGQPLRRADQEAKIKFEGNVSASNGSAKVQILADSYWVNIEDGRTATTGKPSGKLIKGVGAKWQGSNGIQTQKILADIELKYQNSKKFSRLSKTGQRLSKPKKKLSFSEAAKRLSFIFAMSIERKGIPPKPFVDRVLNSDRLKLLTDKLSEVMGKNIVAELTLDSEYKKIKINV